MPNRLERVKRIAPLMRQDRLKAATYDAVVPALQTQIQEQEDIIAQAIAGLLPAPVDGGDWDGKLNYIAGTVAVWDGVGYIAKKYSRGKQPDTSPDHWEIYVAVPEAIIWADADSGYPFATGDRVEHNGVIWTCIKAHTKSQVRVPLVGSQWWEVD